MPIRLKYLARSIYDQLGTEKFKKLSENCICDKIFRAHRSFAQLVWSMHQQMRVELVGRNRIESHHAKF